MSSYDPRYPRPPHLDRELERVARAALGAGVDLYGRWYSLGLRHAGRAAENALACWRDLPEPEDALHLWTSGLRDLWSDMAGAAVYALQDYAGGLEPSGSRELPASHLVDGKVVMLPARIREASQAMAMWAVPVDKASAALATRLGDEAALFRVLELGDGSTPFSLFVVDYKESDLGSYHELGAAFFVRPASDPGAMPGMLAVDLPVDQPFTCTAGREIWGYPKTLDFVDLTYEPDSLTCSLHRRGRGKTRPSPALTLRFPRGGDASSSDVPLPTYTLRNRVPCLTCFTRSGAGETLRACKAGAVKLTLGRSTDPLVAMLVQLGIDDTTAPMLRGWTEHMSGEFGVPRLLAGG